MTADDLAALRVRLTARVDEAMAVLTEARRELNELPQVVGPPRPYGELTPREHEVLELLAEGYSTAQIASTLFIEHTTVRNHIQNVMRKTGTHSRLAAVVEMGGES